MSLIVVVQMGSVSPARVAEDSTVALMLEARRRGHELFRCAPDALSLNDGKVCALVEHVSHDDFDTEHSIGLDTMDLAACDVVLMRQDPPVDMGYLSATHLLERLHPDTLVVNDPVQVRNSPEKLFATEFQDFIPPTLISRSIEEISDFRSDWGDIVMKPLYGAAGSGVVMIKREDENFASLVEIFSATYREPWVIQKYLPEVKLGDKRVIIVDGLVAGVVNRIPATGEFRSNFACGGKGVAASLTDREIAICEHLGPILRARGLIFVGIDLVAEYLMEINVTSPTGIRPVDQFDGKDVASMVWDAIEVRC